MKYDPKNPNWTPVTNSEANQLTCNTHKPGSSYWCPTSALPSPLTQIPGPYTACVSLYPSTYKDNRNVDVFGGLVVAGSGQGTGKAYLFPLGVSESTVQFAGPHKPKPEHHYAISDGVPVEKLFDKSPKPQSRK